LIPRAPHPTGRENGGSGTMAFDFDPAIVEVAAS